MQRVEISIKNCNETKILVAEGTKLPCIYSTSMKKIYCKRFYIQSIIHLNFTQLIILISSSSVPLTLILLIVYCISSSP